tara:strand:- start:755 stop:910 length:156 start_codon:yes stop_codon:yes gene_type:complete
MKRVLSLLFAISINAGPALSWGNGECPFSKGGEQQGTSSEKVEESEFSKKD